MLIMWLITAATVLVAVVVIAIVAFGKEGTEKDSGELSHALAQATRHLNGEADPPKPLVELFGAIPDPRPSARSAASASDFTPQPAKQAAR